MATRQRRTVPAGGSYFPGPCWHDGAWWASDFSTRRVTRVSPDGTRTVVAEVDVPHAGRP